MNEFTKEELEDLRDAVFISGKPIELYDKLQSLLDNYCEHKKEHVFYTESNMGICKKCGQIGFRLRDRGVSDE
jgi:hypothetical protein